MTRLSLLDTISLYESMWLGHLAPLESATASWRGFDLAEETAILARFSAFVADTPDCFERSSPAGHITGSALVVSDDLSRVLLTLHRKLGLWLQLGGHADGNPRVHQVAYREVMEESGLAAIRFLPYEPMLSSAARHLAAGESPLPFDFDCHLIPARLGESAHVHYDVRYVIVADPDERLLMSEESKDLRWFTFAEARALTDEHSMQRQFDKVEWLRDRMAKVSIFERPLTGSSPVLTFQ